MTRSIVFSWANVPAQDEQLLAIRPTNTSMATSTCPMEKEGMPA
jgi:hypothetical protein